MKIQFINHAGIKIVSEEVSLLCDPWIEGTAFHNGWSLLADTKFEYKDFELVTHIWFSHEHPDHFSPPNLLKIPKEYRENIVVLFQATVDRKVAAFCKKIGFKEIIELKEDAEYEITSSFKITCNSYTDGDSYALFHVEDVKILNLNDCMVNSIEAAEEIRSKVGRVDLLFTQFGYANKIGNVDDVEKRKIASLEKLQRIKYQVEIFNPSHIIPFASFIYFCHSENVYLNFGANDIEVVYNFIERELNKPCIVLYPNDIWDCKSLWDSKHAIEKYHADARNKIGKNLLVASDVDYQELMGLSRKFIHQLKSGFPMHSRNIGRLNSCIYITDYQEYWELNGRQGLVKCKIQENVNWDVQVGSEALSYCFKELWGGETLRINGRFQASPTYSKFRQFTDIASALNRKEDYPYPSKWFKILKKLAG
jgi:UDP-MurNAc hydroxylase